MNGKQRYTERAMRVLNWAQEEARSRGAQAMDTEHILLGLLKERGSIAISILESMGITPDEIRNEIDSLSEKKPPVPSIDAITESAKNVLTLLGEEAAALGHSYIGTEHILLALLREEGVASEVLTGLGADYETVREEIIKRVGGQIKEPSAPQQKAHAVRSRTPTLDAYGRDLTELAT